jgi:PTS system nitrogen regulatory IIA component
MRLTELVTPEVVKAPLTGTTKRTVIRELVALCCPGAGAEVLEPIFRSVMERERLMSSGIGHGIALPHGYSTGVVEFAASLGIAARPVDFDAVDGRPVAIVFLLLSDEEHTGDKLKALARISRLLHNDSFRAALAASRSPEEAIRAIVDEEAQHRI